MARSVKWTDVAWRDLEEVADYIAKDSRYYAGAFVCEVRDAARSLVHFSERVTAEVRKRRDTGLPFDTLPPITETLPRDQEMG